MLAVINYALRIAIFKKFFVLLYTIGFMSIKTQIQLKSPYIQ